MANRYFKEIILKSLTGILLISTYNISFSQLKSTIKPYLNFSINTVHQPSFKINKVSHTTLNERYKMPTNQLMYWPNYPLKAEQIEERRRITDLPPGKQLLNDFIESNVNWLIYNKNKKPVANIPKF